MSEALIIGCGDLGSVIASGLIEAGLEVTGVRISNKSVPQSVRFVQADVTCMDALHALKNLTPNILIYCIAATAQTDENYHAHYVQGLKNVLQTVSHTQLQHVFFVSSTRVYGQTSDNLLDESIVAIPSDFGGIRLLEAENVLKSYPFNSTVLRLSGIYGAGRLRMVNLAQNVDNWPPTNTYSNRINRDDAARFIIFLCEKVRKNEAVSECYIVTDSAPVSQYEVLNWIAMQLKLPQKLAPVITAGKRLSNQRLLNTGFELDYPSYQQGYAPMIKALT